MSLSKSYAVFGLGRYGKAVAKELVSSGVEVLAVDSDPNVINSLAMEIPYCKCADVTDPESIKQLGVSNIDVVIIAMANSMEASVLTTMLCKDAGVKNIIAKCSTEIQGKILRKVGVDKVVLPEIESGVRLAKNLLSSGFVDLIELDNDVSMVEVSVKESWIGKNLMELDLRKNYTMNIVAIRQGGDVTINIDPLTPLTADMQLIVIGNTARLRKFSE